MIYELYHEICDTRKEVALTLALDSAVLGRVHFSAPYSIVASNNLDVRPEYSRCGTLFLRRIWDMDP